MLRYAITDRQIFGGNLEVMLERLVVLAPDVDYIQLRERDLPASALETFTVKLLTALAPLPVRPLVVVNHRADVAIACGADGVHLRSGPGELTPSQVRELYSQAGMPRPGVSVSCHSLEEVARAKDADLVLFGPVFEKPLPSQSPLHGTGIALLAEACRVAAPTPVLALGGVTPQNQQACLDAGAAGIAGIRCFLIPPH
jgi:thiamine-phosphate pyrophosphorylase